MHTGVPATLELSLTRLHDIVWSVDCTADVNVIAYVEENPERESSAAW